MENKNAKKKHRKLENKKNIKKRTYDEMLKNSKSLGELEEDKLKFNSRLKIKYDEKNYLSKDDNLDIPEQNNKNEFKNKFKKMENAIIDILNECSDSNENKNVSYLQKELIPKINNLSINKEFIASNHELQDIIINRNEIPAKAIQSINVHGDGNCLFRCLSKIYFNNENYHLFFRKYIFDYILKNYTKYWII